jgi:arsenite methyltransferase
MTEVHTSMPPALRQALDLLIDPPENPDVSKGYLDLLSTGSDTDDTLPKNIGAIQAAWESPMGSLLYDHVQDMSRRLIRAWQYPLDWLNIPPGGTALDVGSGPGNVTASLARAAGRGGLALGVDISEPMLVRAVRAQSGARVGFIRTDAQRLPLRDNTVDAVVSLAMLQLIPNPSAALAEMARVLRPGGRLMIMVPIFGNMARFRRNVSNVGVYVFHNDEIGDILEDNGFATVRVKNFGNLQWVRGKRG